MFQAKNRNSRKFCKKNGYLLHIFSYLIVSKAIHIYLTYKCSKKTKKNKTQNSNMKQTTKRKSTKPEQPFVSGSALTWKVKYISKN